MEQVLAVLAVFVGGGVSATLLGFVGDWLRDRRVDGREARAREAEREFERNAFQRQALLELGDALDALTTVYSEIYLYLLNASAGQGDIGNGLPSPELQERRAMDRNRVRLLSSRVIDKPLRDLVDKGLAKLATAFQYRSSFGEAHGAMSDGSELLGNAMIRCGEIAREL